VYIPSYVDCLLARSGWNWFSCVDGGIDQLVSWEVTYCMCYGSADIWDYVHLYTYCSEISCLCWWYDWIYSCSYGNNSEVSFICVVDGTG